MNDDLKAYVDGELPPDAAERLRSAMASDPALGEEVEELRALSVALRRLPEPEPVGQATTLAALRQRRPAPLWRVWAPALMACAAALFFASVVSRRSLKPTVIIASGPPKVVAEPDAVEATIPEVRRESFVRFVRERGGMVRADGPSALRAFYPESAHDALRSRFLLPEGVLWRTDGLRVRLVKE